MGEVLFHGSNQMFEDIDLGMSKNRRDFGRGFYMTTIEAQAAQWAENQYARHGGEGVYVYEIEAVFSDSLKVCRFENLCTEWLEMVKANRLCGGVQHGFDVVRGPVANDNTMRTVALYLDGVYTAEMAIGQLRYFKANDQVSVHTKIAADCLKIIGRR